MAKKKDLGELIQIRYLAKRDTLSKFQKILRKVFTEEKRNLVVDMVTAPEISSDYLNHLTFLTQALKMQGYSITFILDPKNYHTLKQTDQSKLYIFEIGTVVSNNEITSMINENTQSQLEVPGVLIEKNQVFLEDDFDHEYLEDHIGQIIKVFGSIIVDVTELTSIPSTLIHLFILQTIQHSSVFIIKVNEVQHNLISKNPQAAILNLRKPASEPPAFKLNMSDPALPAIVAEEDELEEAPPSAPKEEDDAIAFKLVVNTLEVGMISPEQYVAQLDDYIHLLNDCGNHVYIDLSEVKILDLNVWKKSLEIYLEMAITGKVLGFKMLENQKPDWEKWIPSAEVVERKVNEEPQFNIAGSRLEVKFVSPMLFVQEFPTYFQKLLSTGNKSIAIDISNLKELSTPCIEILVLSYLDCVGRGLSMILRISPEVEDLFKKSGRGKTLPLEIVKPEFARRVNHFSGGKVKGIDMSKINAAIAEDKLTNKVLKKEFESVHIEARGSLQNWEPVPASHEQQEKYSGAERRLERRYHGEDVEVSFARGTLGKINDRRYKAENISQSGISFASTSQLSKGEPLRLKLFYEKNPGVEVAATVIWCSPVSSQALFRMGLKFSNPSAVAKSRIMEILQKIYRNK
ncbi:PilZ domain-containing protein [Candidatus Uabimicrobium sp. HlEnr_7]|uniref:PilZ domain-containing protein n=1 Tax=Candidatus Uabimicrobium helgolandensis TaxID=3095367 RepID=UPI0035580136